MAFKAELMQPLPPAGGSGGEGSDCLPAAPFCDETAALFWRSAGRKLKAQVTQTQGKNSQ